MCLIKLRPKQKSTLKFNLNYRTIDKNSNDSPQIVQLISTQIFVTDNSHRIFGHAFWPHASDLMFNACNS